MSFPPPRFRSYDITNLIASGSRNLLCKVGQPQWLTPLQNARWDSARDIAGMSITNRPFGGEFVAVGPVIFQASWGYLVIIFSNDDQLTWNRHIYETIQVNLSNDSTWQEFLSTKNMFKWRIASLHCWHSPKDSHGNWCLKKSSTPCLRHGHPMEKMPSSEAVGIGDHLKQREIAVDGCLFCLNCHLVMVFLHAVFLHVIDDHFCRFWGRWSIKILSKHLSISSKYHMIYLIILIYMNDLIHFQPACHSFDSWQGDHWFCLNTFSKFPNIWILPVLLFRCFQFQGSKPQQSVP